MTGRVGWLDCSSGVSGDMLLGALADLDALGDLPEVLARAPELGARVEINPVQRGGLRACQVQVHAGQAQPTRTRADVQAVLDSLHLSDGVRARADRVFDRLASAEAAVHGIEPALVHFPEGGAVDAIVDVVRTCLGFQALGLDRLTVGRVALGGGRTTGRHGEVPVPGPAVLKLLESAQLQAHGGSDDVELATPTGVALLAELADGSGALPPVVVAATGTGAGGRDLPDRPNVVRLVVGDAVTHADEADQWLLVEANVDDLDPRLWPRVIEALLAAGAADAWLTPILMKKGRPAHTVSALTDTARADAVRTALFLESSTIGVRSTRVDKNALDRECVAVDVDGHKVSVKVARLGGVVVSATPEWDDVESAADALGRPAKHVLAAATAAARTALG